MGNGGADVATFSSSGMYRRNLYRIPCAAQEANELEERSARDASSMDILFSGLYEWQEAAILGLPLVMRYGMERRLTRLCTSIRGGTVS